MLEIFLGITFVVVCCTCFQLRRYSREYEEDQARLSRYRRTQIIRRARNTNRNNRRNSQEIEKRKKYIRENVMIKKVSPISDNDDKTKMKHSLVESNDADFDKKSVVSTDEESGKFEEVDLSSDAATATSASNLEVEDNEDESNEKNRKESFFSNAIRSIRASIRASLTDCSASSSQTKENVCPICLDTYNDGDEMCLSKNEKCHHSFHYDCMVGWLIDHDDCPICRAKYILPQSKSPLQGLAAFTISTIRGAENV